MRRYLLDTGIMGDLMSRRLGVAEKVEEVRRRGDRVGTCWPVAGELWFGLEGSATRERNLQRLIRTLNELINRNLIFHHAAGTNVSVLRS